MMKPRMVAIVLAVAQGAAIGALGMLAADPLVTLAVAFAVVVALAMLSAAYRVVSSPPAPRDDLQRAAVHRALCALREVLGEDCEYWRRPALPTPLGVAGGEVVRGYVPAPCSLLQAVDRVAPPGTAVNQVVLDELAYAICPYSVMESRRLIDAFEGWCGDPAVIAAKIKTVTDLWAPGEVSEVRERLRLTHGDYPPA